MRHIAYRFFDALKPYFSIQKVYFSIKGLTSVFKCANIKKSNIMGDIYERNF